jgi:hypothetical protein
MKVWIGSVAWTLVVFMCFRQWRRPLSQPRLLDIVEIQEREQALIAIYDMLDSFEKQGVDVISGVGYVSSIFRLKV